MVCKRCLACATEQSEWHGDTVPRSSLKPEPFLLPSGQRKLGVSVGEPATEGVGRGLLNS